MCITKSTSAAGWVCYAEKTHGEWILPYLSTAKSPQAVAGSLIKGAVSAMPAAAAPALNGCGCHSTAAAPPHDADAASHRGSNGAVNVVNGASNGGVQDYGGGAGGVMCGVDTDVQQAGDERAAAAAAAKAAGGAVTGGYEGDLHGVGRAAAPSVYHVAIMPCYDKKLEAARSDFALPMNGAGGGDGDHQEWGPGDDAVPETDSVLTTSEVHELLQAHAVRLSEAGAVELPLDDWQPFVAGRVAHPRPGGAAGCADSRGRTARSCCGAASDEMGVDHVAGGACSDGDCCGGRGAAHEAEPPGSVGSAGRDLLPGVRGGSGGYLEFAVKHAAWVMHGVVRIPHSLFPRAVPFVLSEGRTPDARV